MRLAIDFDHTIQDNDNRDAAKNMRMGPPFPHAKETLQLFREAGHTIIIHSCNRPKLIRDWMEYYQIPFDIIWGESPADCGHKPVADWYIDDCGMAFKGDWLDIKKQVDSSMDYYATRASK